MYEGNAATSSQMGVIAILTRLMELTGGRRGALLRAFVSINAAGIAVAFLPFRKAIGFGSVALKRQSDLTPDDYVWAIEAVARRLPWRVVCIQKGLALQRLLRSRGLDAVLHYGARLEAEAGTLEAHVWVTVNGVQVIGGDSIDSFAKIASFPSPQPTIAH